MDIVSPNGGIKSPVGDNKTNWGFAISESGRGGSEKRSAIPKGMKYAQLGTWNGQFGILYQIGFCLLLVLIILLVLSMCPFVQ